MNFNKLGTDDLESLTAEQERYLLEEKYQQEWIKKTQTLKRLNIMPQDGSKNVYLGL